MKIVKMRKSVLVSTMVAISLLFGSIGVFASSGIEKIQAYLNHDIKFKLNGSTWTPRDNNGAKLAPIIYDGSTYLPARAVAEALNSEVKWDNKTQTIIINSGGSSSNEGIPYKDAEAVTPAKSNNRSSSSNGLLTLPRNFNLASQKEALKSEAVKIMKLYAESLKDGDMSSLDGYVNSRVADSLGGDSWVKGRKSIREDLKNEVKSVRDVNSSSILRDYVASLNKVSTGSLEEPTGAGDNNYASFTYHYYPKDFNAFSSVSVNLEFKATSDGSLVLVNIYILG